MIVETVHLDEQLVERLLPLVVAATEPDTAAATDGVDLVDEHDGRGRLLRLLEEVAHPAGTNADKHLDEVGSRNREEGHTRLAGDGTSEQSLARPRRTGEQHAFGHTGAHGAKAIG